MFRQERKLLEAGVKAPDFRLPLLDGGDLALAEMVAQGPALLAFFKISCPVCQLTFPFLERIHRSGALAIYGIAQDEAKDTRDFAKRFGITFPMLLDSKKSGYQASNAYGISSVPAMFRVDRNGAIEQVLLGWRKQEMIALGAVGPGEQVPEWKAG